MFQITTMEGWYPLMSMMIDAYNRYLVVVFFLLVIKICHYLLVNLTLAVMVNNLQKQKQDDLEYLINRKQDLLNLLTERKRQLGISLKEVEFSIMKNPRKAVGYCLNTFLICNDI